MKLIRRRAKVRALVLRTNALFARGAMAARQVLTLKIEVRVLAGEPSLPTPCVGRFLVSRVAKGS